VKSEPVLVRKLAVGGIVSLLLLAGCGGGTNPPVSRGSNPTPTITAISPNSTVAGGAAFTLTINGTNFVAASTVNFGGSAPATTFVSSTQLTAAIPAASIASTGTPAATVTNPAPGGGSSNALTFTITTGSVDPQSIALDPTGKFAYVMDGGSDGDGGYVSMYTINPTTGALASIGPPVSTYGYGVYFGSGVNAGSVAVDSLGKFAYITNAGDVYDYGDGADGSVAIYAINATTGALTSTGTINGNCPGLCLPSSVVVDPSGRLAYVANGGGGVPFNVAMYTINSTTGVLTSIGTIAAGTDPLSVAVDPAGKFAYVANWTGYDTDGSVSMYTIDATTGGLTPIGTIDTGLSPTSIAIHPSGKFAYVTNSGSNDVSMYTIDATTGALTFIGSINAGTDPVSVAVDPAGKFAYVANWTAYDTDGSISMYTIDATTGGLTPIGTIATEVSPTSIAIHPSGKFAYVTNSGSNSVSMYSIDSATGTLTLIGTIGT
jgi:YVTN family beta-propeller protein